MSIESAMPSNHLILCHPLLLLPSVFASIRVFSNESVLRIGWSVYWSFSISPSHEYSGLISFRIDWFDILTVQGTLKNLLQHHSSKASILWCSAFCLELKVGQVLGQVWRTGQLSGFSSDTAPILRCGKQAPHAPPRSSVSSPKTLYSPPSRDQTTCVQPGWEWAAPSHLGK